MPKKNLDQIEIGQVFEKHIKKCFKDDRVTVSEEFGVSLPFISMVCKGVKSPNQDMLDSMGYKKTKTTSFSKIQKVKQ